MKLVFAFINLIIFSSDMSILLLIYLFISFVFTRM